MITIIHLNINGKPKCGTSSYRRPWLIALADTGVNCKKCLGTGRKPAKSLKLKENLVGKILHYSWGYDMTINEFFVIRKQTDHSVLTEKIGTDGYGGFNGQETPNKNKKTGEFVRFLVKPASWNNERYYFVGNGGKGATIHDGKPSYYNTLD